MSKGVLGDIWCYHGSKGRYFNKIEEVLKNEQGYRSVIDLFSGGSSIATSLPVEWSVTANDRESRVIDLSVQLQKLLTVCSPEEVELIIRNHCRINVSSNKDKEGYLTLKDKYNKGDRTALNLFALTMSSNSNMIRFNSSGEQTLQFGNRWYNSNSIKKMISYLERIAERDIEFVSKDFREYSEQYPYDIWIIDPPYRTSKATYSETGQWSMKDEVELLNLCDKLEKEGKKFIYFNQTFTQGTENKVVNYWKDKYTHQILADTTSNCSAQRKNVGKTVEIMVYNF